MPKPMHRLDYRGFTIETDWAIAGLNPWITTITDNATRRIYPVMVGPFDRPIEQMRTAKEQLDYVLDNGLWPPGNGEEAKRVEAVGD